MIRRAILSLAVLGATVPAAQAQVAKDINADPFFEASYCQYTAAAFNDKQTAQSWKEIATDLALARGIAEAGDELEKLDDLALDLAPITASDEDRPIYEQCRERLAGLRQNTRTARSPVNSYAPAKVTWYDRTGVAIERDAAKKAEALNKVRAWDAYCFMSGQSLATMIEQNPSGFGLDLRKPEHAKLLQAVKSETAKFRAQFEKDFSASERPQMEPVFGQQRDNYGKGYFERKDSDKDIAEFAKRQVFECSEGFEQIWASMSR